MKRNVILRKIMKNGIQNNLSATFSKDELRTAYRADFREVVPSTRV